MADNYLGRKMEEYFARQNGGTAARRPGATLGRLLLKNRSHRGYDSGFLVREDQLRRIIGGPGASERFARRMVGELRRDSAPNDR